MKIPIQIGILILGAKILFAGQSVGDLSKMFPKQIAGGEEDIPAMMSAANFVCKGEVISAPEPTFSREDGPRMTATAYVRLDRCFKGDLTGKTVGVQIDNVLEAAGGSWHAFVLHPGEYDLLFLKPWNDRYITANQFYGALPISRKSGAKIEDADPLIRLELDLKEGLKDQDAEAVISNIQRLGSMGKLRSNAELKAIVNSRDPLRKAYALEALLKLKDHSAMAELADLFDSTPEHVGSFRLPEDRLASKISWLFYQVGLIRDPETLPYIEKFALSSNSWLRTHAMRALVAMDAPRSVPVFLRELNDVPNAFAAMQALIRLAGPGKVADWIPSRNEFLSRPEYYTAKCREWWQAEGESKMKIRIAK